MIRHAAILPALIAGLVIALPAAASGIPQPGLSTYPTFIRIVGTAAGVPDIVTGRFTVVARDIASNPVPNAFIQLDFSVAPDIRIASDQMDPSLVNDCTGHTIGAYTDASGVATFTVVGGSWAAGTFSGGGAVPIRGNSVPLGTVTACAFDLDGIGGVTTADLSVWISDLGSHTYRARGDYDGNGVNSTSDLSIWLAELGTHRSSESAATCP